MARFTAFSLIDSFNADFNFYARNFYNDLFANNVDSDLFGRNYSDVYAINGYDAPVDLVLLAAGEGFGTDRDGLLNRGTVRILGEAVFEGRDLWFMDGIDISAVDMMRAIRTRDNGDDRALMAQALSGDDVITLGLYSDRFEGCDGNDLMLGAGGDDTLFGGAGNDVLDGGVGRDRLIGGTGNDLFFATAGDIVIEGQNAGIDRVQTGVAWQLQAGVENLTLTGGAHVAGTGNTLSNTLTGNGGNNVLTGLAGNDILYGGAGNDRLMGGLGADRLTGGTGADLVEGGWGRDDLYAGADSARDVFVFRAPADSTVGAGRDTIHQFRTGQDDIDLRLMDADTGVTGNQRFGFSTDGAAEHAVWIAQTSGGVIVRGDLNGDLRADFEIRVDGVSQLGAGDFLL